MPVEHPYQRLDWAADWWESRPAAHRGRACIVSVVGRRDGRPWLLLPLVHQWRAGLRTLSWLGGTLTDYPSALVGPLCPEAALAGGFPQIWRAIRAALPRTDLLLAPRQLPTVGGRPNPLVQLHHTQSPVSAHHTHPGRDWEAFYRRHCSGRTRRRHGQKLRKMKRSGPVHFSVVDDPTEAARVLPRVFAMKARAYAALGVDDPLADPATRAFITHQVTNPRHPGHLSLLTVGDHIWAAHVGWQHEGTMYLQFPTYRHGAAAAASPGAELIRRLLQHAIQAGLHTVDFTIGDDPHKDRWCDDTVALVDVAEPLSLRGRAIARGARTWTEVKRRLKQCPTTYQAALRGRAHLFGT